MKKTEYEQKQEYLKQKELYQQMRLETKMSELIRSLSSYHITDNTVLSTLETEIRPLQQRLSTLLNQIENFKQQE